jgi:ParB family chromosome partitioning protein
MNLQSLPLSAITRISPLNPRLDEDDVSQLAATIKAAGLQYPLLVIPRPDVAGEYEVIDGGRRWRALKSFLGESEEVPVEIHDGDEHSARRATLALSITPRALHPVAEFEAFAKLVDAGFDVAAIAKDFALTERHVKQRLALGSLAPCVREAWRKGEISRDSAEAFTIGPIEAQEALFNSWAGTVYAMRLRQPYEIRKGLRGDAMEADSSVARYLTADPARLEAYRAAGGRIDEDLFSEEVGLRDKPIADKVARELLQAQAEKVAVAEGWGAALVEIDGFALERRQVAEAFNAEQGLTETEKACIDNIEADLEQADGEAEIAALEAERDEIFLAALLRQVTPNERAWLGVAVTLAWDGEPIFTRGVRPPPAESGEVLEEGAGGGDREDAEEGDDVSPPAAPAKGEEKAPSGPFAEPGKALRPVIEAAVSKALQDATGRRVDLALMFTVAALGAQYGVSGLSGLRPLLRIEGDDDCELLRRISEQSFAEALAECAGASTNDLTVAFARLVGHAFNATGASMEAMTALVGAARARGANMVSAFGEAIDRKGFFEAAPKAQVLKIVAGLIGEGEAKHCKSMDRTKLAEYVAKLSFDKGHLPSPFADWSRLPELEHAAGEAMLVPGETPLAEAMAKAIDADEKAPKAARKLPKVPGKAPRKTAARKPAAKKQASRASTKKVAAKSPTKAVATKRRAAKKGARR